MVDKPEKIGDVQEPEPKPYGKVRFKKRHPSYKSVVPHNKISRDRLTGKLFCTMETRTPLHVGSGIYVMAPSGPVRGLILSDRSVVVPGTSIKGAIRSITEAISDSCVPIAGPETKPGLPPELRACREVKSRHRDRQARGEAQLCVACRIFGGLGYQGRVSFTDARLVAGKTEIHQIRSPFQPRHWGNDYKDNLGSYDGQKFYYHGETVSSPNGEPYVVIAEKSELDFEMNFENLAVEEFYLILVATGILDGIVIKLGGGKQAMLGSVEILPNRLQLLDPNSFESFSGGVRMFDNEIYRELEGLVGDADGLLNNDALAELMDIWEWPSSRHAPTGNY